MLRAGRFLAQSDLVSDEQLIDDAGGYTGASNVALGIRSSPSRPAHWAATRAKITRTLNGNDAWAAVVEAWLDEIEFELLSGDVALAIWNPGDILSSVMKTLASDDGDALPKLEAQLIRGDDVVRTITGLLVWEKTATRATLREAFQMIYDGDAFRWAVAHSLGETRYFDIDLCSATGLRYACIEFLPGDRLPRVLELDGGGLRRREIEMAELDRELLRPLIEWLETNRDAIADLIDEVRDCTTGLLDGP